MNTMFLLMAEYNTAVIPLSAVSEKYFGMKPEHAERKAATCKLPIVTFRAGSTQKAPRMVHIKDLADYIDQQRTEGIALHQILQK
ncbi:pyocin activator PrtN family protein [Erwinia pyri]|uniref:Pyocin activator PrtN family protein n=1 Tax=Erwinia pyri TaxID=3062598 RepID=A0AA50DFK0_9GAMM|nr:pyocin activator PrtN family protein [Erwinia sp. DE2]WLS77254.1 pyocin activator PrtN family protein [Erwinia sp. DE2]